MKGSTLFALMLATVVAAITVFAPAEPVGQFIA